MTVHFVTKGCRLNIHESAVMRRMARDAGVQQECVVINSCAVTAEAERDTRQTIRRLRRRHPDSLLVVTGCAAHRSMEDYAALAEVDVVMDNDAKRQWRHFKKLATMKPKKTHHAASMLRGDDEWGDGVNHSGIDFAGMTRAYVAVQRGCDHDCTFCAIPQGRGKSRSLPLEQVIDEAQQLVAMGYQELIVTGVDITAWGKDLPNAPNFSQLLEQLVRRGGMKRLRLSSLDAAELDEAAVDIITTSDVVMPAIHLSAQAGDDVILKRMKRRHSAAQLRRLCERLIHGRDDMVFGADLIVGFPTESEAMFERTLDLVRACPLSFLHVFPFAAREGTAASRMPPVAASVIKERAARLRALGDTMRQNFLRSMLGRQVSLLMEQEGYGRSECGVMVRLGRLSRQEQAGQIVSCRITHVTHGELKGV